MKIPDLVPVTSEITDPDLWRYVVVPPPRERHHFDIYLNDADDSRWETGTPLIECGHQYGAWRGALVWNPGKNLYQIEFGSYGPAEPSPAALAFDFKSIRDNEEAALQRHERLNKIRFDLEAQWADLDEDRRITWESKL